MPTEQSYPPKVFKTQLQDLMRTHQPPLSDAWLAEFLNVVPLTARRIRQGKDLRLTEALKLARFFNRKVEQIWSIK